MAGKNGSVGRNRQIQVGGVAVALGLAAIAVFAPPVANAGSKLQFFGYAAVKCQHDDPYDAAVKTDYSDEVAGFTNANHVCLPGDVARWPAFLKQAAALYDPVVQLEPLFDFAPGGSGPDSDAARGMWQAFVAAVAASGVPSSRFYFLLADEPALHKIPPDQIDRAAAIIHATFDTDRVMLVEAFSFDGAPPISPQIDLWAFDAYGIRDPGAEPLYSAFLDSARAQMHKDQRLWIVMDGSYSLNHINGGITPEAMADVARATYRFAMAQPDVAGIITYLWAGGVDPGEKGVRDLPPVVRAAHEAIGRQILADLAR